MSNDQPTKKDFYIWGITFFLIISGGIVLCAYGVRDCYSAKEYNNLYQKTDTYIVSVRYSERRGQEVIEGYTSHCCRYYTYYIVINNYTYTVNNTIYFGEHRYTTESFGDVQESMENLGKEYITIYYLISDPNIVIYELAECFNAYFVGMIICYSIFLGVVLPTFFAVYCLNKLNKVHPQRSIIQPDRSIIQPQTNVVQPDTSIV
jgi:hypothetical protein